LRFWLFREAALISVAAASLDVSTLPEIQAHPLVGLEAGAS